ncbi:type II toxin-antitoxin system VapC family toxin (plasmid) [Deinococcus radiomollis]|uniref:type II toxin-antitoxin system tRNA(fMet)-specific endonuclease VapC n=1 Tax=Deinococcus radiomollis TaxID=468916 RepID=UPI0038916537
MRYLLDTNICIFIIKNRPAAVRAHFEALRPGEIGISAITEAELLHGAYKSERVERNLAAYYDFSAHIAVIPFDPQVIDTYGRIRATLERAGKPIGPLDFQIAATAMARGLILVTNNASEFERVTGLSIEDWTQA